jgi:hypothetical protein
MAEATIAMQGNGAENTSFQLLIKLVGQMGETSATLRSIDTGLAELRTNTTAQLAMLQERVGKSEALNGVQNERIQQLERDRDALRAEVSALKIAHATDLQKIRAEQQEDNRTRWMVRGGITVIAVLAPLLWEYVLLPLFLR